jgi:intein/homing endonuclease
MSISKNKPNIKRKEMSSSTYLNLEEVKSDQVYKQLPEFTRISRYAQYNKQKKRRETWEEQVDRVFKMHKVKFAKYLENKTFIEMFNYAKEMMLKKKILGSQRALQFGGPAIINKNTRIFNCCATYVDRTRVFQEIMFSLLCGVGVGFSVQIHHIKKLPGITKPGEGTKKYVIPDSIEGWSDAIGILLSSYFVTGEFSEYRGQNVSFNFSEIRPKGSTISHMGGKAPGPDGLKNSLTKIKQILDICCSKSKYLKPIDAYDIIMHLSDAVLSGGIRRCISKGSLVSTLLGSYKPIEKIKVGDVVSTNNGWKPVTKTFIQGTQKTIKIIHSEGSLICTLNHRVAILTDIHGNFKWKEAGKLKKNEKLLYIEPDLIDTGENKLPLFPLFAESTCRFCEEWKDIIIPELDEKIAWLLGNICGNGYIFLTGSVHIAVEPNNITQVVFVQEQLQRFGVNTGITAPPEKDKCTKIYVNSKQLATYLHSWLKQPKTSMNIPECILNGTRNIKFAYIQGLMDSNECIKGRSSLLVVSIYPNYLKQIQNLLYSLGVVSRFKEYWNPPSNTFRVSFHHSDHTLDPKESYSLSILLNCDRDKFNKGCSFGWKKFPMTCVGKEYRYGNSIPMKMFNELKERPKQIARNSKRISIDTWKLYENNKYIPINVESIEEYKEVETYDIEVEGNHNFMCEGILVHNSATLALFSLEDDEMMNAKTGDWYITNPQRGRSNNSVLLLRNKVEKKSYQKLIEKVKQFGEPGIIFADDTETLFNPCVPDDTWVLTSKGLKQVKDLINKPFKAIVDDKEYNCKTGFIKTGENKQVFQIVTLEGYKVKATNNHKFMTNNNVWVELKNLRIGDKLRMHKHNGKNIYNTINGNTTITNIIKDKICDVFDCEVDIIHAFNANWFYVHNCVEVALYGYDEHGNSGIEMCVSGDTTLLTKFGKHKIIDVIGKDIEIWNGEKWSLVKPVNTGTNQELYQVLFSDGSYLNCTFNHKFKVKHKFMNKYIEVTTLELISIISSSKYNWNIPKSNIKYNNYGFVEKYAYEYGFVLGDIYHTPSTECPLINVDLFKKLPLNCIINKNNLASRETQRSKGAYPKESVSEGAYPKESVSEGAYPKESVSEGGESNYKLVQFDQLNNDFIYKLKYDIGLPTEIFSWDKNSITEFIAGWIDSGGSKDNGGCRIYGIENKIRDLQLLLTKIGVYSSVNLKTNWYSLIPDCTTLKSYKLSFDQKIVCMTDKYQVIKNIKKLNGYHDTYCLEEKEKHMCLFNNVMTMQCNLSEINMGDVKNEKEFYESCRAASILGTFQAAYTNMGYLGKVTQNIVEKEALLGVSMTGMMDTPIISFNPEFLKKGAEIVKETNKILAKIIEINQSARTTCVKPAGSTSCILGTSSGIHPCHSERYLRRVQCNKLEGPLAFFKKYNPQAVTESVWSSNKTDDVITFLCKSKQGALTRTDVSAIDLLEKVKLVQKYWVTEGRNIELCVKPWLNHNVSNTITIKPTEWDNVINFIYENRKYFAGISMLAESGDLTYPQAPFQSVYTHEEIAKTYGAGSLLSSGLIVHGLQAFNGNLYDACSCVLNYGEKLNMPVFDINDISHSFVDSDKIYAKIRWVAQAKKFASRHFNNDLEKMTHCLKCVDSWKTWCDLKRTYTQVPWNQFFEESDNTKPTDYVACSGDSCTLISF